MQFLKNQSQKKLKFSKLPNLMIIGAMKCGTTSLHHYLNFHPQIAMSKAKELHFFVEGKNWHKGLKWYQSHFDSEAPIRGETSPSYTAYPKWQGVPEKMQSVVPDAKLIYIVRDPIKRIISHYLNRYAAGVEHRGINEVLAADFESDYVLRSCYSMQLEQYRQYFPDSNILVITLEQLQNNRQATLKKIFQYLQIEDSLPLQISEQALHKSSQKRRKNALGLFISQLPLIHRTSRLPHELRWAVENILYFPLSQKIEKPELDESLRQKLIEYLRKDIEDLRTYTGDNFQEWCI
ncbi:MAG: sulfotransferase [Jaaginema sp. PMC 1079.18]|nr:sulfotransferase [Jaaginema sp. PMC 1080.18]MEC4850830.1 sulfotransferase [Jaaginema sp. PMC 1079.18]MEC4868372.1 sulfotransferase [Jaaginema sp. PMC 1078.18]